MPLQLKDLSQHDWDELLNTALHDLRTPLTTMYGYSQLVVNQKNPAQLAHKLAVEAQRTAVEVDAFLNVLSARKKTLKYVWKEYNALAIAQRAREWIQEQYPQVKFFFDDKKATPIPFTADEHLLSSLFMILFLYFFNQKDDKDDLHLEIKNTPHPEIILSTESFLRLHNTGESPALSLPAYSSRNSFLFYFVEEISSVHHIQTTWHFISSEIFSVALRFP